MGIAETPERLPQKPAVGAGRVDRMCQVLWRYRDAIESPGTGEIQLHFHDRSLKIRFISYLVEYPP
jgi:hypothetical protein